jgi:hypothetical protein
MLDTTVAGGVKASHTPRYCILEEADEEASLPKDFVETNTKDAGYVSYVSRSSRTGYIQPSILWCYDLDLTPGADGVVIEPKPQDEEVEEFVLMSVDEVVMAMKAGKFKPNCNLVTLDFFFRHGLLGGELAEEAKGLEGKLRRNLPVPVAGLDG